MNVLLYIVNTALKCMRSSVFNFVFFFLFYEFVYIFMFTLCTLSSVENCVKTTRCEHFVLKNEHFFLMRDLWIIADLLANIWEMIELILSPNKLIADDAITFIRQLPLLKLFWLLSPAPDAIAKVNKLDRKWKHSLKNLMESIHFKKSNKLSLSLP